MGIDRNLFIGPYVKCKIEKVKKQVTVTGCPKCKVEIGEPFCCKCGTPRDTFSKTQIEEKVNTWKLEEKLKEQLITVPDCGTFSEKFDIYISNVRFPRKRTKAEIGDEDSEGRSFPIKN
jgi:hypothetical protein